MMNLSGMKLSRQTALLAAALMAIGFLLGAAMATAEQAGKVDGQEVEMLFVQSALGGSFDGERLALNGVGTTLMFTDRPVRIDGHLATETFVKRWDKGSDSFSDDPPNAVLSILGGDGAKNIVVELLDPKLEGTTVSYQTKVSDGTVPKSFGSASLFIDGKAGGYIGAALGGAVLGRGLTKANMNAEYAREQASQPQYAAPPPPQYSQPQAAPDYSYRSAPPPPCQCNCG